MDKIDVSKIDLGSARALARSLLSVVDALGAAKDSESRLDRSEEALSKVKIELRKTQEAPDARRAEIASSEQTAKTKIVEAESECQKLVAAALERAAEIVKSAEANAVAIVKRAQDRAKAVEGALVGAQQKLHSVTGASV